MISNNKLKSILEELNLSKNEIRFYLTSFSIGESTLGQIAKSAKMDRSSCYNAFNALKQRDLIFENFKKYSKKVLVKSPKKIVRKLQKKNKKLQHHILDFKTAMPELMAEYNKKSIKPTIRFYQGKNGFKAIQDDILSNGNNILVFTNQTTEKTFFNKAEHQKFIKQRIKAKLKIKVLTKKDKYSLILKHNDAKELRKTKFLSQNASFTAETYIYGNKVAMFAHKKEFIGFIIESQEFAQAQEAIFLELWKYAQ